MQIKPNPPILESSFIHLLLPIAGVDCPFYSKIEYS